ncbi:MAG TPA: DUF1801 domain-containing protein [Armatimonadota bacterium]|jgi:uncharacterized protein YdhG (YjbR/CyaY superfamily)
MAGIPQTVDAYLATVDAEKRAALEELRKTIKAIVSAAVEDMSYRLPTFRLQGKLLASFGAAANHLAFYLATTDIPQDELKGYDVSKGAIRFQPDHPLSISLVRKLVEARIAKIND